MCVAFLTPSGMFCFCQSKKDDASEGAGEAGSPEKADAEGSSDEDEGALVIDEKSEKGGNKRKVQEPTEVRLTGGVWGTIGGARAPFEICQNALRCLPSG